MWAVCWLMVTIWTIFRCRMRNRDGIRHLHRIRHLHWDFDMFLANVLYFSVTFFFVQFLLHQLVVNVALLFRGRLADLLGNLVIGHVTGLVHQSLAPADDLSLVPGHLDGVTLCLRHFLALLTKSRLEPSGLTFF